MSLHHDVKTKRAGMNPKKADEAKTLLFKRKT